MSTINGKVGYVKFERIDGVHAALSMTNVILIDKPLIVSQVFENRIPDETDAMLYCAPLIPNVSLISGGPTWPSTVINRLVGQPPNAYIETIDPELTDRNLPPYPALPGTLDIPKIEEIRRTVYLSNMDKEVGLDVLNEFLSQIGEVRYIRSAYTDENAETRAAYVEFSEQPCIPKVLSINGFQFFGRPLLVNHATSCVIKPATVRGLRSDDDDMRFSGSRSRSKSRRQESDADERSDADRHSTSRSKSRKKSSKPVRSPKRRSRSKKRSRSRSSRDRKRRSRSSSYDRHRRKKDSRKRSRSRSKDRHRRDDSSRKEKKTRR